MNCKNCGNQIPLGYGTCPSCGSPVDGIKSIDEINKIKNEPLFTKEEVRIESTNSSDDPKRKMKMMIIAGGIIFSFFIIILITVIIPLFRPDDNNKNKNNNTPNEYTLIGDDEKGYLTLPGKWERYTEGIDTTADSYTIDGSWVISIDSYETSASIPNASILADNIMKVKKYVKSITFLEKYVITISDYEAYQVLSYDEETKQWLSEIYFLASDGKIHYISIAGKEDNNKYKDVPNTFSLTKSM